MHSTHFKTDPRHVIPRAASAYQATHHGWQHAEAPVTLPGPGTLWTTVGDLDLWLTHLRQHWHHPHQLPWQETVAYEPSDHEPYLYGPGLYADARPGRTAVFHYGHELGFSAAAHVEASGLRVIALSNNAGLSADRVTAAILRDLHQPSTLAPKEALVRATALERTPSTATRDQPTPDDLGQHTELGTFTCDQAPGSLRLTRRADDLHLWRRGTSDQLTPRCTGIYAGNGYILTVPSSAVEVDRFTLDLDRAPGLTYIRQ